MRGREFSLLAERLLQKLFTVETEEKQEVTGEKSA
jgi:hypothetical protein